jgi:hypothetical integral membrane protein (TIGR02206 family)
MKTDFRLFGPLHLAIIAAVPLAAWLLSRAAGRRTRIVLGLLLLVNELIWYGYKLRTEGWRFPEGLPLQLCDLTLWMTVIAALTLKPWAVETAYLAGVGGAGMAVLTPELWAPAFSYPTMYFFAAHGGLIVVILTILGSRMAKLGPGCVWRVLAVTNLFAAFDALFNAVFQTNYMFLCRKPSSASLLDSLGPWPWYIAAGEVLTLVIFWLLWLAYAGFRRRDGGRFRPPA